MQWKSEAERKYISEKTSEPLVPAEKRPCRGVMQMPESQPVKKIQILLKHVSTLTLCGLVTRFIIHFQTSLVAPGHIFRVENILERCGAARRGVV